MNHLLRYNLSLRWNLRPPQLRWKQWQRQRQQQMRQLLAGPLPQVLLRAPRLRQLSPDPLPLLPVVVVTPPRLASQDKLRWQRRKRRHLKRRAQQLQQNRYHRRRLQLQDARPLWQKWRALGLLKREDRLSFAGSLTGAQKP